MIRLKSDEVQGLPPGDYLVLARLFLETWPSEKWTPETLAEDLASRVDLKVEHFIAWDGDRLVGHAEIFPRTIYSAGGPLTVGALSGVVVRPEYRRRGIGARLVRAALARVDEGSFPVALWQTETPDFYTRLGARAIDNPWVNKKGNNPQADPWPDEVKMIYPSDFPWPQGVLDLGGPEF